MITIECKVCDESIKTQDAEKVIAFDREHTALHAASPGSPTPATESGQA